MIEWYGYLHVNGDIITKRFFGPDDVVETEKSDFVVEVFGPFEEVNHDNAAEILYNKFYWQSQQIKGNFTG